MTAVEEDQAVTGILEFGQLEGVIADLQGQRGKLVTAIELQKLMFYLLPGIDNITTEIFYEQGPVTAVPEPTCSRWPIAVTVLAVFLIRKKTRA